MKINSKINKLWKKYDNRIERFKMCKFCSDSGCDNPDYHEQQLMQLSFELGLNSAKHKNKQQSK